MKIILALFVTTLTLSQAETAIFMGALSEGAEAQLQLVNKGSPLKIPGGSTPGPFNLEPGSYPAIVTYKEQEWKGDLVIEAEKATAFLLHEIEGKITVSPFPFSSEPSTESSITGISLEKARAISCNGKDLMAQPGLPTLWATWKEGGMVVEAEDGTVLHGVAEDDLGSKHFVVIYKADDQLRSLAFIHQSAAEPPPEQAGEGEMEEELPVMNPLEQDLIKAQLGKTIRIKATVVSVGESKSGKTRYVNFSPRGQSISLAMTSETGGTIWTRETLETLISKTIEATGVVEEAGEQTLIFIKDPAHMQAITEEPVPEPTEAP